MPEVSFVEHLNSGTAKSLLRYEVGSGTTMPRTGARVWEQTQIRNHQAKQLIFDIITDDMSAAEKHRRVQNFTRAVNQHIKKLAKGEGITAELSTYWARHSYATKAIVSGASMEYVSEALGHSDLKTTQGYFAGDSQQKQLQEKLLEFE